MRISRTMVLLAAAGLAGCGGGPAADRPGRRSGLLRSTLEAWRAGETPDALKGRSPPVTVVDRDWGKGTKLAKFEIEEAAAQPHGHDLGCPVKLWLGDGSKPPVRVRYVVALLPNKVVTRDFGG